MTFLESRFRNIVRLLAILLFVLFHPLFLC
jgi:hypothetical protein